MPTEPKCPPGVCQSDGFVLVQTFPRKTFHTGSGWEGLRSLARAVRARSQQRIVRSPNRKIPSAGTAYDWVEASSGSTALPALASASTKLTGQKTKLLRAADLERTSRLGSR
jgi:hypothetical protein